MFWFKEPVLVATNTAGLHKNTHKLDLAMDQKPSCLILSCQKYTFLLRQDTKGNCNFRNQSQAEIWWYVGSSVVCYKQL